MEINTGKYIANGGVSVHVNDPGVPPCWFSDWLLGLLFQYYGFIFFFIFF